jgi:hypothetical protein
LNNQGRPAMFFKSFQVMSYYRQYHSILKLYQGFTISLVRQALFFPLFAFSLAFLEKQVTAF